MPVRITAKAFAVWGCILVLASINGAFREAVLIPYLGNPHGLVISGLLLCGFVFTVAYLLMPWVGARRRVELWLIGFGWLVLTLIFEFAFGLLQGRALVEILEAYSFANGNIWPVVLGFVLVSPWLTARIRGWL